MCSLSGELLDLNYFEIKIKVKKCSNISSWHIFSASALAARHRLTRLLHTLPFVPYSTREGLGIACDSVQFGIPDLHIRRRRERAHLTDLHIVLLTDPGWLGVRVKFLPPTISTFPSRADEGISGSLPATGEGQFSGYTCFRSRLIRIHAMYALSTCTCLTPKL